jgi:seryl-tRNA synthetase
VGDQSEKIFQELTNIKLLTLKSNYKLEQKLDELKAENNAKIKNIEMALYGDEKGKLKGVIQKVQENSDYIEKDKKHKWLTRGGVIVALFLIKFWTSIISILKAII